MLTREQIYTMIAIRDREGSVFHPRGKKDKLSNNIIQMISDVDLVPHAEISMLLHHVAYGDFVAAREMLERNPRLVLEAGNVETPSGLQVIRTTPLECAIGGGDPEMVAMIAPYFDRIKGGDKLREASYARYRPHVENMMHQDSYDFTRLVEVLKHVSIDDVLTEFDYPRSEYQTDLTIALNQFKEYFAIGKITVGMHCNYQHLLRAYEIYAREYNNLKKKGYHLCAHRLFCCQVIGFLQRGLPAVDRQVFAQGLQDVVENHAVNERSFNCKSSPREFFPITTGSDLCSGLGFRNFVSVKDGVLNMPLEKQPSAPWWWETPLFGKYISDKWARLLELIKSPRQENVSQCVIF